jgi:HEAT repeats
VHRTAAAGSDCEGNVTAPPRPVTFLFGGGGARMWLSETRLCSATVPELIGFLSRSHYLDRAGSARQLVNRKEQPEIVWPHLLAARADESWMVRMQVPRATVHLGVLADQAIPVLREMLDDHDAVVQSYSAWALERFGQGRQSDILAELVRQGRRKPSDRAEGSVVSGCGEPNR